MANNIDNYTNIYKYMHIYKIQIHKNIYTHSRHKPMKLWDFSILNTSIEPSISLYFMNFFYFLYHELKNSVISHFDIAC